jgi:hypothetical protein
MTLSTPIKIVALAGLALVLGLGGLVLVMGGNASSSNVVVTPPAAPQRTQHAKPAAHKPVLHLDANLPSAVRQALERHPAAVVVVYSSRSVGDAAVLAAARSGAHAAHIGFVAANVAREPVAAAMAAWTSSVMDPAVLIVHRPGTVVLTLGGPTDSVSVAQAATSAR